MRVSTCVAIAALVVPLQAWAAVPNSVVALLGPSLGGLLGQDDLCGWGLAGRIETTYRNDFKSIGLTDAQAAAVWAEAHGRQAEMAKIPADGQARMKAEMCTAAGRQQFERKLAD
jgi:hypothetical protein